MMNITLQIKIQKQLEEKERELQYIIQKLKQEIEKSPPGRLRISSNSSGEAYYQVEENHNQEANANNGRYISKKEMEFIQKLAQKGYDKKVLSWAENCEKAFKKLLKVYSDDQIDRIYRELTESRKKLVTPIFDDLERKQEKWINQPYEGKGFTDDLRIIYTEKGERVRSKSEKILADKFFREEIPYHYEQPLELPGYGIIYPDFTLYHTGTGKEYYWEHFGMMDQPEYAARAIGKIELYEKRGIFPGDSLLCSYETLKNGFSMGQVNALIHEYFLT